MEANNGALTAAVAAYLVAARQAGRSEATVRQYGWHLDRLAGWLAGRGVGGVAEVTRDLLREWGAGLLDGWAPATVKQAVSAARAFFSWCMEEELVTSDVGRVLKVPAVPKRVQRTVTTDEVQKLLAACDPKTAKGLRDLALISLLVDTGLRASEVCRVKVADVALAGCYLVVAVKGGQQMAVFFGETAAERLRAWLEVRPVTKGVATVFVSLGGTTPGQPLTTHGLRIILRRLGEKMGIKGVTTHAFRRGFACIATEAGAPSRMVQLAGRWNDIRMVERYTEAMTRGGLYQLGWSPADYVANKKSVKLDV